MSIKKKKKEEKTYKSSGRALLGYLRSNKIYWCYLWRNVRLLHYISMRQHQMCTSTAAPLPGMIHLGPQHSFNWHHLCFKQMFSSSWWALKGLYPWGEFRKNSTNAGQKTPLWNNRIKTLIKLIINPGLNKGKLFIFLANKLVSSR